MSEHVVGVIAEAHLAALQAIESKMGATYMGLAVAARSARRAGRISVRICRRLERLDMAWHVVRHTTSGRLTELANELSADLEKDPDPAGLGKGSGGKARIDAIELEEGESAVDVTEKMGKRYEYLSSQVAAVHGEDRRSENGYGKARSGTSQAEEKCR